MTKYYSYLGKWKIAEDFPLFCKTSALIHANFQRFINKIDVCLVLCEELWMLNVTRSQVNVETEFGVVSLILIFL